MLLLYQLEYCQISLQLLVMDKLNQQMIFFEEKHSTNIEEGFQRENDCLQSIPYLKKGDSNIYLDQFLAKDQEVIPPSVPKVDSSFEEDVSSGGNADESYQVQESTHFNPSAFHNFQKHLTVCLKHSINIVPDDLIPKDFEVAGAKLWKTFKNSAVSTKKILHFLLGEKNEHPITNEALKEYGLLKIYELYDEETMKEARLYLASETLRQIREGKLDEYISGKRLKDKNKFRRYVQIFVNELENGYLRKRLPKDKVAYLLHC